VISIFAIGRIERRTGLLIIMRRCAPGQFVHKPNPARLTWLVDWPADCKDALGQVFAS